MRDANAIIERCARETGALVVDLGGFRGRRVLMADHVHPTAFGQIAIAERALAVLERDGLRRGRGRRELSARESTRWRRLRGDATYAYRHAKVSAEAAPNLRGCGSGCGARVGRLERDLAQAGEHAAGADELGARGAALLQRAHDGLAVALEEGVALEQRGAREVGLRDEPAGGVERRRRSRCCGLAVASAVAPVAELLAARDGGEPARGGAVVEAARDGGGELAGGAREQLVQGGQRVGGQRDGADARAARRWPRR